MKWILPVEGLSDLFVLNLDMLLLRKHNFLLRFYSSYKLFLYFLSEFHRFPMRAQEWLKGSLSEEVKINFRVENVVPGWIIEILNKQYYKNIVEISYRYTTSSDTLQNYLKTHFWVGNVRYISYLWYENTTNVMKSRKYDYENILGSKIYSMIIILNMRLE